MFSAIAPDGNDSRYVESGNTFRVGDLVEFLPTSICRELSGKCLRVAFIHQIPAPDDSVWYRLECQWRSEDRIAVDANERFFAKWQPLELPAK